MWPPLSQHTHTTPHTHDLIHILYTCTHHTSLHPHHKIYHIHATIYTPHNTYSIPHNNIITTYIYHTCVLYTHHTHNIYHNAYQKYHITHIYSHMPTIQAAYLHIQIPCMYIIYFMITLQYHACVKHNNQTYATHIHRICPHHTHMCAQHTHYSGNVFVRLRTLQEIGRAMPFWNSCVLTSRSWTVR